MQFMRYRDVASVSVDFDKDYILSMKFTGTDVTNAPYNRPVDFYATNLYKADRDSTIYADSNLSQTTDEATPLFINGDYIGANHGEHAQINVYGASHGKSFSDIGSVWLDNEGAKFTLVAVYDGYLAFVSENIGESEERYSFKKEISGSLTHFDGAEHKDKIQVNKQINTMLMPSIRVINRKVYACVGEERFEALLSTKADRVEIVDEYYIINPATVAAELTALRPEGGYSYNPQLSDFGRPMVHYKIIYRITDDGTVLSDIDIRRLAPVNWTRCMGHMCQDRANAYFGGIYRCYPKTLPLACEGVTYDFTVPYRVDAGPYLKDFALTSDFWLDKNSPPDRMVDYLADTKGDYVLAFTAGYLPIFDGERTVRKNITNAQLLYSTRKFYPILKDGDIEAVRGVAFKKYFRPISNNISAFSVTYSGKKYHYVDFLGDGEYTFECAEKSEVYECYGDIEIARNNGEYTLRGTHGTALIIEALR